MATKTQTKPAAKPAPVKKIQTKTEIRNAQAQAGKILRGLDNETAAVLKLTNQIGEKVGRICSGAVVAKSLLEGISNAALTQSTPVSPVAAAKKPAAKKPAKPAAAKKPAKPAKPAAAKKPAAKPAAAKKPAAKPAKPAVDENRPQLRQVIFSSLEGGKKTAAEIYHSAEDTAKKQGFKCWTRQSLYNLLDRAVQKGEICKEGEKDKAVFSLAAKKAEASDDEAERLLQRASGDKATATVI